MAAARSHEHRPNQVIDAQSRLGYQAARPVVASVAAQACGGKATDSQYERALTQERVKAGLAAAKRRGRRGGRPPEIVPEKLEAIIAALNGGATKAAVCRTFGTKRTTLIETLARAGWSGPGTKATGKELECPSPF